MKDTSYVQKETADLYYTAQMFWSFTLNFFFGFCVACITVYFAGLELAMILMLATIWAILLRRTKEPVRPNQPINPDKLGF